MKKYFLLTAILSLLIALPSQAGLKFGLKAGVNLSDVSFSNDEWEKSVDPSNYTGFQVGPIMELTIPVIGIGMDAALLYSQTGFKSPVSLDGDGLSTNDETIKMGSILIPVNLKYKLELLGLVGVYATAGPYAEFKVYDDLGSFKNAMETETFGAGLNFGIGAELLSKLQIGVNYQLGLTEDYGKSDKTDMAIEAFNGKTRVWSITAALFF